MSPQQSDSHPVKDKVEANVQNIVEHAQQEVETSREPWYRTSRRAQILIGIYIAEFVLFALLGWYVHFNPVLPVDVAITREFQENQMPWLKGFMVAVSFLGNQAIIFTALIFLTALFFWIVRLRLEALLIVSLSIVSGITNTLIKLLVSRPRPTAQLVDIFQYATGQSFPSGHVMSYVAFWGLLFSLGLILFRRDRWWHYALLIIPAFFVVFVGPSRIYLGDHWASDVLGGYLFGGLLLGIALWVYLRLKERGVLTPKWDSKDTLFQMFQRHRPAH
ncbi:MAG: phosphatase PAP2 family protein [Ktedonobacteraceae bacterium]|nr:phosphatase PAP2 family protein [Ktedonobacteraceae bacterium]